MKCVGSFFFADFAKSMSSKCRMRDHKTWTSSSVSPHIFEHLCSHVHGFHTVISICLKWGGGGIPFDILIFVILIKSLYTFNECCYKFSLTFLLRN